MKGIVFGVLLALFLANYSAAAELGEASTRDQPQLEAQSDTAGEEPLEKSAAKPVQSEGDRALRQPVCSQPQRRRVPGQGPESLRQ